MSVQNKVEIQNVYKIFGRRPQKALLAVQQGTNKEKLLESSDHNLAVNNINLSIGEGELFVVMGLSGSGKSTLVRLINRLIDPTSGTILVDGENIIEYNSQQLRDLRRFKISMVFQKFGLLPHKTILENVGYGLQIQKKEKTEQEATATHWIEKVGLKGYENSYPRQLSGGMQQRVGLARALATNPQVLLMDEPFSALDPIFRNEMQDIVLELQKELKKTVIFITHDVAEAIKLGHRIAILKDGELQQVGTPQQIIENPVNDYVSQFVTTQDSN